MYVLNVIIIKNVCPCKCQYQIFVKKTLKKPKSVPAHLIPVTCDKLTNQHIPSQSINTSVKVQSYLITSASHLAVLSWMNIFNTERLHNFNCM